MNSQNTIKWLTYLMFMMFAMSTDSVGEIIPLAMKEFNLTMTSGGAMHYAPMVAIALSGVLLGFLADRLGRKVTIILGLIIYALNSFLFLAGNSFWFFVGLLSVSGIAIGIFKTGALALIGDISTSTSQHTSIMNTVEGFFGFGAIVGPFLVRFLIEQGVSWKWLYVIVGGLCLLLIAIASGVSYPRSKQNIQESFSVANTFTMMTNPFAFSFSLGLFLYVAVECAIYVWMPTFLKGYQGSAIFFATYALTIFFVLRAAGRFLGTWILQHISWTTVLMLFSGAIFLCFLGSVLGGVEAAIYLLPLSGLFMSMIYPTINSKGISCFRKAEHGAVAGVLLFFTCVGAAVGPLAMGWVSDRFGGAQFGFWLATVFAAMLFLGTLINWKWDPAQKVLKRLDQSEYEELNAH
jgi:fucose permease